MKRRLQPEMLDVLPPGDPLAQGSRRDLRRINAIMGNARLVAAKLISAARDQPPRRIIDLGAGDGAFTLGLLEHLPALERGTELILLDQSLTADERIVTKLHARGFRPQVIQADAWDWLHALPPQPGTWVVANLFLHHFTAEKLSMAFAELNQKADVVCACEPRRAQWPLLASRLLWALGANAVTRHDAVVSVQAGFAGQELSTLWPAAGIENWQLQERAVGMFSHLFLAQRTNVVRFSAP